MKSIDALKSRLTSSNTLFVQNEDGFLGEMGFEWRGPVSEDEIQEFEERHSILLPASFKDFLRISNGATLFRDIQYGQWGCRILGLDELLDVTNYVRDWGYELKRDWLVFATWVGDCDILVFDISNSKAGSRKIIIDGEQGERIDEWAYIDGDFAKWLDRLIVAQGAKYWRW